MYIDVWKYGCYIAYHHDLFINSQQRRVEMKITPRYCKKCGHFVPAWNDDTLIRSLYLKQPGILSIFPPCHFLPTANCEGSPNGAQYLEGQPRDVREGMYSYAKDRESSIREGFRLACKLGERGYPAYIELFPRTT